MESEDIFIGNYRLISLLSSGAFGQVYLAHHAVLTNRVVAVKLMHMSSLKNPEEFVRFLAEPHFLEKLQHPYILPIIDAGIDRDTGIPYQVTMYASNGSLRERLRRYSSRPLSLVEAITILSQVGLALQYAHDQNIVHRDLKPENILFNEKGDALVADFGIATVLSTSSIKQTSTLGTYQYMAPEEYQDLICKESDQYALACIAYELFTGHLPFQASSVAAMIAKHLTESPRSPRYYNPELPEHIEKALLKALAKQRTERYASISAFVTALAANPISSLQEEKSGIDYFGEGVFFFDNKDYKKALIAFENAVRVDPNSSLSWFYISDLYKFLGNPDESKSAYEKARELHKIEFDEEFEDEYEAEEYGELEDEYEAFGDDSIAFDDDIQLSISSDSDKNSGDANKIKDEFEVCMNAGHMMYELQRYEEALAAYNRAIRFNSKSALTFYSKGMSLVQLNRYKEAIDTFEQAVYINPDFEEAYNSMGIAFYQINHYSEALNAFSQAIRLNPRNKSTWLMKTNMLLALGRNHEALTASQEIIRLDSSSADAFALKGTALDGLGHYEEAVMTYELALSLDPNHVQAYNNIGNTLSRLGRYKEALMAFEKAIQLEPDFALPYSGKGSIYLGLEQYNDALSAFNMAIQYAPTFAEPYNGKGVTLAQCGYYREALLACEQALKLDPQNANYWRNKGKTLFEMKEYKECLEILERAIQLNPKLVSAYVDKGNTLNILGKFNEALATFDQAIQLGLSDADIYNGRGNALRSLQRFDEALLAFEQAIKLDPKEAIFL